MKGRQDRGAGTCGGGIVARGKEEVRLPCPVGMVSHWESVPSARPMANFEESGILSRIQLAWRYLVAGQGTVALRWQRKAAHRPEPETSTTQDHYWLSQSRLGLDASVQWPQNQCGSGPQMVVLSSQAGETVAQLATGADSEEEIVQRILLIEIEGLKRFYVLRLLPAEVVWLLEHVVTRQQITDLAVRVDDGIQLAMDAAFVLYVREALVRGLQAQERILASSGENIEVVLPYILGLHLVHFVQDWADPTLGGWYFSGGARTRTETQQAMRLAEKVQSLLDSVPPPVIPGSKEPSDGIPLLLDDVEALAIGARMERRAWEIALGSVLGVG